jgi:hypothetical protein
MIVDQFTIVIKLPAAQCHKGMNVMLRGERIGTITRVLRMAEYAECHVWLNRRGRRVVSTNPSFAGSSKDNVANMTFGVSL